MRVPKLRRIQKIVLIVASLAVFYLGTALILKAIGLSNVQWVMQQTGVWAPAIFVALCAISLILAPLSGSSLFIVGGTLFGKEAGFLLGYFATLLGCNVNFWISRRLGRKAVSWLISEKHVDELNQLTQKVRSHHEIFYLMVTLIFSQDIVSYAAGLTSIQYRKFLIALVISGAAVIGTQIYFGSSLLEAIVKG
ncbi:MAG TPA: VTT domain-containing protein [Coleofasciculaceae cyanobacterium]